MPEKISGMIIVLQPIRCEKKLQKITALTATRINLNFKFNNKLAFSFTRRLIFNFTVSNTAIDLFLFQLMSNQRIKMNDVLWKNKVESSRQDQAQLDSTSESRKIVFCSQFLFCVYSVMNYTGNYFWDLALFLFEQKVKEKSFT